MADFKKDYLQFYKDTYRSIAEVIKEREGLTVTMEPKLFIPDAPASLIKPDFSSLNKNEPISNKTPKVEPFSLSQYDFGSFIDEKYKEKFLQKYGQDGSYNKNNMSSLIYEVANDIYEHYLKRDINDTSRIFERMLCLGIDRLSSEEQQVIKDMANT